MLISMIQLQWNPFDIRALLKYPKKPQIKNKRYFEKRFKGRIAENIQYYEKGQKYSL